MIANDARYALQQLRKIKHYHDADFAKALDKADLPKLIEVRLHLIRDCAQRAIDAVERISNEDCQKILHEDGVIHTIYGDV